ncbi:MAG: rod shape-determining protein MreC [bacterium]
MATIRRQGFLSWVALVLALLFSALMMATSSHSSAEAARARANDLLATLTRPLGIVSHVVLLRNENTRLRLENTRLLQKASLAKEAVYENDRLRRLLDLRVRSELTLKAAEVIGRNPMSGVNSMLLNAGARKGIMKQMAVLSDRGLVGKIIRVGENTAVCQLLTDRNLGAAVVLVECRANGITDWSGLNRLRIDEIPYSAPVHLGEQVYSSGLDGIFPAGVPMGYVTCTERIQESLFQQVELEPFVDFYSLEEVFIVMDNPNRLAP